MCGITGILYNTIHNGLEIYESLLSIQHRGQDGAGICCMNNQVNMIKKSGLINNLCSYNELLQMNARIFLAHTRYKTNNIQNSFQPFHLQNSKLNMTFCHNGNIINTNQIIDILCNKYHITNENEVSDSYLLFQLIFHYLNEDIHTHICEDNIVRLSNFLHENVEGSYSLILGIENYGLIAMKDKYGIRPLIYGKNENNDILISSESCSVNNISRYNICRDINPGETYVFMYNQKEYTYQYEKSVFSPCLFEYIYFSRLDSIVNKISIYTCRYMLGVLLGKIIMKDQLDVDFIIPTPETSRVYAYGMSKIMNVPIQECIIKNRYINRTFIIENKNKIEENIKRKFSVIKEIVKDKKALLIDDSIVRGNTSKNIIKLLRDSGIKEVIFCSAAPKIHNTNNYGIFIEKKEELITYNNKSSEEIAASIGANKIYYNSLEDINALIYDLNPYIKQMETSMFQDN